MNRKQIIQRYSVNSHGIITNPGKFEGEMLYAPYFYALMMESAYDEEHGDGSVSFSVTEQDIAEFPELAGKTDVMLSVDDAGFVWASAKGATMNSQSHDEPTYSRICATLADLFNERHCRDDDVPKATPDDVRQVHRKYGLDKAPWPTATSASLEVRMIQDGLDKFLC